MASASVQKETFTFHSLDAPVKLDVVHDATVKEEGPRKALVFYHGGGLFSGSRSSRFPPLPVQMLIDRGWVIIVPDYRLLPEASIADMLEDTRHLEDWIVQNAQKLGFTLDNVAVGGSSAGSFVSILTLHAWQKIQPRAFYSTWSMVNTTDPWYSTVRGENDMFGPTPGHKLVDSNFEELLRPGNPKVSDDSVPMTDPRSRSCFFLWLLKTGKIGGMINNSLKDATGTMNLLDLIKSPVPPTVIVHGTKDTIAPITDSRRLAECIQDVGGKVKLIEVDGADHGIMPQDKYSKLFKDSVDYLEEFCDSK